MRYLLRTLVSFLVLSGLSASAQEHVEQDEKSHDSCDVRLNGDYIKSYFSDSWDVLKSPVRWKGRQWGTAAGVLGVSIALYAIDEDVRDLARRNQSEGLDNASKYVFEPLGSGIVTLPLTIGFYAYGSIAGKQRTSRVGLTGIKAMAVTAVFTYGLKYATQRHSPYDDEPPDPRIWEGPFGSYKSTSFPSGHSSVVWAVAAVFSSEYRDRLWVPIVSYTLASLASASRVYEDQHWASDVFFGAALGFFIGKFVYWSTLKCPELVIVPGVSASGHPGFTMAYQLK